MRSVFVRLRRVTSTQQCTLPMCSYASLLGTVSHCASTNPCGDVIDNLCAYAVFFIRTFVCTVQCYEIDDKKSNFQLIISTINFEFFI